MAKSRPRVASPYFRTNEMMQWLNPSWASSENATLGALVSRMETLRLPDLTVRLDFGHVAAAFARQEVDAHLHTQMELFRVESGQTTFYVADKPVVYRTGAVAIMPARTIHRWINGKRTSEFLAFMVTAEPLSADRQSLGYQLSAAAAALNYHARPDPALQQALDGIWREIRERRDDAVQVCAAHLSVALTLIFRQLRDAVRCPVPRDSVPLSERYVLAAQAYIRTHLSEELSVQRIADVTGISGRHLNRMFSAAGLGSIGQCIERTRIEHAQWLLRRGNYPVKIVAKLCGFRGTPYFSRVFRHVTGRPPSSVRNVADDRVTGFH